MSKPLNHSSWSTLSDEEKEAWEKASEKYAARQVGNSYPTGRAYHAIVVGWTQRQAINAERRKRK